MKVLLDQGLARLTVGLLAAQGVDAQHVGNIGMARSTDEAIIEFARKEQWTVVTLDADFHALLVKSGQVLAFPTNRGRRGGGECESLDHGP